MYCRNSACFLPRLETLSFRHRPRRPSMQRAKPWNTLWRNLSGFGTRREPRAHFRDSSARESKAVDLLEGTERGEASPHQTNFTCTIITGEPNEFVREIRTRMPVILPEEHHDAWLSGESGKEILVPYPAERMKAWPVSPRVNSPKNMTLRSSRRSSFKDAFSRGELRQRRVGGKM